MESTWRNIPGFVDYVISVDGVLVRRICRGSLVNKVIKPQKQHKGDIQGPRGGVLSTVEIYNGERFTRVSIQKLLALAFVGIPEDPTDVAVLIDTDLPLSGNNIKWRPKSYSLSQLTCRKGHDLSEGNYYETVLQRTGVKRCKICHRESVRTYEHAKTQRRQRQRERDQGQFA